MMLMAVYVFFRSRVHARIVIPIRMTHAAIQRMKSFVGNGSVFMDSLMNAIIPVTTTMMASTKGILSDGFI